MPLTLLPAPPRIKKAIYTSIILGTRGTVKFYYLSISKKNKLKMFNMISKPHKKNMAFKSRLRLNISSCIAAFWSLPPFVRAKSCDFAGKED